MSVARIGMAPRLPHLSIEAFQRHWRGRHGAVAGGIPGVRRYVQNHPVVDGGAYLLPYPGFDACSEMEFDDVGALHSAFASPHYQRSVRQDERAFIDGSRHSLVIGERRVFARASGPGGAVKVITFLRAHPARDPARLLEAAASDYRARVGADPAVVGHEQVVPLGAASTARAPDACELVDIVWFAGVPDALSALRSGGLADGLLSLAGFAFGAARVIARPVNVV